jgi:hypothetical protein
LYGLLIIFSVPTFLVYIPFRVKEILFLIVLINNVIIPLSLIPFFRYKKIVSKQVSDTGKERVIPLLVSALLFCITSFIMYRLPLAGFLKAYFYALSFLAVTLLLVNLWYNISLHSAAAGSTLALVLSLSIKMSAGIPLLITGVIMISGLILSSRMLLNVHNRGEIFSGYLCGFFITGLVLMLSY